MKGCHNPPQCSRTGAFPSGHLLEGKVLPLNMGCSQHIQSPANKGEVNQNWSSNMYWEMIIMIKKALASTLFTSCWFQGDGLRIKVIVQEMELVTHVQTLQEAICISLGANVFGKGINPSALPQLWVNSRADWLPV